MNNFYIKTSGAFALAVLLSWAYLVMPQAFFSLDKRLRDFMFVSRGELPKSNDIVPVRNQVVEIDVSNSNITVEEDTFVGGSSEAGVGYTTTTSH